MHRLDRRPWPLPDAVGVARLPNNLEPDVRGHLLHLYGSRAGEVVAAAEADPALLDRLHPDGPDIVAQAAYAVTHEWALTVEDVLRRRTTVTLRGLADDAVEQRVEELVGVRS